MKTKINYLLLLVLLFLGWNNAYADHGGPHFYQGRAFVHNEAEGAGKVYVRFNDENVDINDITEEQWQPVSCETTVGKCRDNNNGIDHYRSVFYAKPDAGSYFWGWYGEESCAEENLISPDYTYMPYANTNSEDEENPGVDTCYAKFSTVPIYHYNINGSVSSAAPTKGMAGLDRTSGIYVSYCHPDSTLALRTVLSTETSATNTAYVGAFPTRGHAFDRWTIVSAAGVTLAEGYSLTESQSAFDISVTNAMANERGDIDFTGTVQASFTDLTPFNVTVKKSVGKGTITGTSKYIVVKSGERDIEYTTSEHVMAEGDAAYDYQSYEGDELTLEATPAGSNKFYGWYKVEGNKKTLVTSEPTYTINPDEAATYFAYFDDLSMANFRVGFSACQTFEQALAAVSESDDKVILLLKDYEITEGYYTIPAGVTLLIPHNAEQIVEEPYISREVNSDIPTIAYRTLTLANGVHLDVFGTIEIGAIQYTAGNVNKSGGVYANGTGRPGEYSQLIMNGNSSLTMNNGSILRAWGYVTGTGTIDARRGSTTYEQFQIMDWKGGTYAEEMIDNAETYKVFPVNQYFIQNIEVKTTYRPGARMFATTSVCNDSGGVLMKANGVQIIGISNRKDHKPDDVAMFQMDDNDESEDTWVCKGYDATNDLQTYDVNNSAHLSSMTIGLTGLVDYVMESALYDLPITTNMHIHLLSGNLDITQNTVMLPGAKMEVDKKSTITVKEGKSLFLYDTEQWDKYAYYNAYAKKVPFRPGGIASRDVSTAAALGDATINVHGTLEIKGTIYTTAGGANIYSSVEDAGTVKFIANAGDNTDVYQWKSTADPKNVATSCTSAQLKNESGFTPTAGTEAGNSFCYIDFNGEGKWKSLTTVECFTKDEDDIYYIKPGAYVPISRGAAPQEEVDHTYRDHYASTGKIFIQTDITGSSANCQSQWWEVTAVPGHPDLFYCDHEDNRTYYCWKDDKWQEKKFTVTWKNWNDTVLTTYQVKYNTVPQYLSTNPTHGDDASHTYSFSGWLPTPTAVTGDVTYVAQFAERDRMYAITFNDQNNELIELVYAKLGAIPVCSRYTLNPETEEWDSPISAVTGNKVYTLQAKEAKASYTITWLNWNGDVDVIRTDENITTMPAAPAAPSKASDDLHSYTFKEWNPTPLDEGTALTSDLVYTATYTSGPRGYTVTWKNGETTIETDKNVPYGTMPEYNGAAPESEGNVFNGWSPAVAVVTGNATYVAQFRPVLNVTADQEIDANADYATITVENGKALTIDENTTVTTDNLILKGGTAASGQVVAVESDANINATNAYYDLALNTAARHWNAFGVPWVVNLDITPLQEVDGSGNVIRTLVLGRDYDIVYYNGAKRASQGAGYWCWEYVENHAHLLQPGKGYMIGFTTAINIVRFAKAAGAPVIFNGEVELDANAGTRSADDNGWNAMANPMAYHATMNDGPTVGYVHNGGAIGSDGYDKFNLAGGKFIVGKTVYVQSSGDEVVTPTYAAPSTPVIVAAAPARRASVTDKKYLSLSDFYTVGITDAAGKQGGDVCVLPEEDKADKYVIGHDLSQFGMSAAIPQLWIKRYNAQLALNTTAPINEVAEFPMGVYVPAAGEYTISLNAQPNEDYTVYLTQDGQVIWNLSNGAYTVSFAKGSQAGYGLRLTENKAPQVVTGIDEAIVDANGETRKVLINNQVFIIRGNKVYSVDGQMVK